MLNTLTSNKEKDGLIFTLITMGVESPERHLFLITSSVKLSDSLTERNL